MYLPPSEWIERIIRINSVTHQSNDELVRFLAPLLIEAGLKVEEHKVMEGGVSFKNLLAFNQAPDAPDLLALNTHLDTVAPGDLSQWTKTEGDPFQATRVRDRIYGLGAVDVKLDFLCKLWACRLARPWKRPFALVGTYGEERGLIGVQELFKAKKLKPRYALVGEPSNLELIYAHKGHIILTVSTDSPAASSEAVLERKWKGTSAHSSTPDIGDNALLKGLTDIFKRGYGIRRLHAGTNFNKIPDLCEATVVPTQNEVTRQVFAFVRFLEELQRDFKKRRDTRFSPSFTCLSLNMAETDSKGIHLTFDIRTLPDVPTDRIIERIRGELGKIGMHLTSVTFDQPLKGHKTNSFITHAAKTLRACGVKPVLKTKATSTEAAIYSAVGATAIVFGPGISVGNAHRPNEYNSVRQLEQATRFYTALLRNTAGEA